MQDASEHFRGSGFAIFAKLLEQEGTEVRAIPAPGGGSRKFCDRMNAFAQKEGLPGMGYIFWRHPEYTEVEEGVKVSLTRAEKARESGNEARVAEMLKDAENHRNVLRAMKERIDSGEQSGLEAAGPLAKNIGPERTEAIRQQLGPWRRRRGVFPRWQALQSFDQGRGQSAG